MANRSFVSRKIHSLLGVIPVGLFLIEHLLTNYSATKGLDEFTEKVLWLNNLPFIFVLEVFFIWLPILYHGIYGVYIALQAKNNVTNYGYFRNWMFFAQRVTGIITLIFLGWHFWETRMQVALGHVKHEELGYLMHQIFIDPLYFTLYAIGVVSAVFHFTNGLWSFFVSWGITVGPNAQRKLTVATMILFVLISAMGVASMTAFTKVDFLHSNSTKTEQMLDEMNNKGEKTDIYNQHKGMDHMQGDHDMQNHDHQMENH